MFQECKCKGFTSHIRIILYVRVDVALNLYRTYETHFTILLTYVDLSIPDLSNRVFQAQEYQQMTHDNTAKDHWFVVVIMYNYACLCVYVPKCVHAHNIYY